MTIQSTATSTTTTTRCETARTTPALRLSVFGLVAVHHLHTRLQTRLQTRQMVTDDRCRGDRGQATTEYALILLAAALVGLMVVAWATAGGGAARISRLFNNVIDAVIDRV